MKSSVTHSKTALLSNSDSSCGGMWRAKSRDKWRRKIASVDNTRIVSYTRIVNYRKTVINL